MPPAPPPPPASYPPAASGSPTAPNGAIGVGARHGLTSGAPVPPPPKSRRNLVVAGFVVLALVIAGVVVAVTRGGDSASAAQPTRASLHDALVTLRAVRDTFSSSWNAEAISGDGDPFCPQFVLAVPARQGEAIFTMSDGNGAKYTNTAFYENISSFEAEADATKFYDQDKAISQNCQTSTGNLGGIPVIYTITDATRDASGVGREINAIKYEASPTDGSSGVILTGYIVETQIGTLVMTTQFSTYNRVPEVTELSDYYDLTKRAFDKAEAAL